MIVIKSSNIQFKNPQVGQPTKAIKEHYNGRRVIAIVNNEEMMFRFKKEDLPFDSDEDDIIEAIEREVLKDKGQVESTEQENTGMK